jgi:hypothetical protein
MDDVKNTERSADAQETVGDAPKRKSYHSPHLSPLGGIQALIQSHPGLGGDLAPTAGSTAPA